MPDNEMPSENKMAARTLREVAKVYRDWHGPNSTLGVKLEKRADELDPPAPSRTIEDKVRDAVIDYYGLSPDREYMLVNTELWNFMRRHGLVND